VQGRPLMYLVARHLGGGLLHELHTPLLVSAAPQHLLQLCQSCLLQPWAEGKARLQRVLCRGAAHHLCDQPNDAARSCAEAPVGMTALLMVASRRQDTIWRWLQRQG
jgi:hypothetical protein